MTNKKNYIMRVIDRRTGEMECRVCGQRHFAIIKEGGLFKRGSWKCVKGCTL